MLPSFLSGKCFRITSRNKGNFSSGTSQHFHKGEGVIRRNTKDFFFFFLHSAQVITRLDHSACDLVQIPQIQTHLCCMNHDVKQKENASKISTHTVTFHLSFIQLGVFDKNIYTKVVCTHSFCHQRIIKALLTQGCKPLN